MQNDSGFSIFPRVTGPAPILFHQTAPYNWLTITLLFSLEPKSLTPRKETLPHGQTSRSGANGTKPKRRQWFILSNLSKHIGLASEPEYPQLAMSISCFASQRSIIALYTKCGLHDH